MKTKLFSLLAARAILFGTPIYAENNSNEKSTKELATEAIERAMTDVAEKIARGDADKAMNEASEYMNNRLDDTIFVNETSVSHTSNELIDYHDAKHQREAEVINNGIDLAKKVSIGFVVFVISIILLVIMSEYLKRRQKYKIIEKAIENNYPLPDDFFGKKTGPATIKHIHYTQGSTPNTCMKNVSEYKVNDWANFRSGIKWFAWGFSFMLFFIIVGAPIWVFALIPLIIGLGKLYATYKIQKSMDNATTYSQEENKEMPTPPPFDNDTYGNN